MEAAQVPDSELSNFKLRATVGELIAGVGTAIGVGAFAVSGLMALGWTSDHLPGWNDSFFSWTLSIVGIIAGAAALASASCLLAFAIISLGARLADPTGERERFWGLSRRERLFASQELRRWLANETEITAAVVRNTMINRGYAKFLAKATTSETPNASPDENDEPTDRSKALTIAPE